MFPFPVPCVMPPLLRLPATGLLLASLSLVVATGCTREVQNIGATTGANAQPSEPGPGAAPTGTSSPSTSKDGVGSHQPTDESSTADSPTPEQGEPTADVDSDESSSSESSSDGADDENQEELCAEAGNDRHCAPVAPPKWSGPVALAKATKAKELERCQAHGPEVEALFDKVTGEPAECVGCRARLGLPDYGVPQLVEFEDDGCSRDYIVRRIDLNRSECVRVPRWNGAGRQPYWGFRFGPQSGRVTCKPSDPKASVPQLKTSNYFRGCQIERKGRCESTGETCVLKSQELTCVYRKGSHDCPAPYNQERTMLYSEVEDTRGCSECGVESTKGRLEPRGRVGFYEGSSCTESQLREEIQLEQLVGHCRSDEYRKESGWFFIRAEPDEPEFNGSCKAVGWKPEGWVREKDPTTLCCARI